MNDVGVVLVNFNSGWLTASAVASLRAQEFEGRRGGPGRLQIVVVDNQSPTDQRDALEPLKELGVDVVYRDVNDGYGRGMNLGLQRIDAEFCLLANPDILVLDGALDALITLLRRDDSIGAAGPRGYLDADRFILLPPNDLPTLSLHVEESLGRVHRGVARRAAARRTRRYLEAWRADRPLDMRMISGFAMFLRTAFARQLGPFDPSFPFYFEDADLCRRVRAAGKRLVVHPSAEMIHFFDQSARSVREEVMKKYDVSRAYYYRKHYGDGGSLLFDRLNDYASRRAAAGEGWRFSAVDELPPQADPVTVDLGEERDYLMEIATDPAFLFCGGHLGRGASLTFPPRAWGALEATRWYVRLLDPVDRRILRYVTFEKSTSSTGPVSYHDFLAGAAS